MEDVHINIMDDDDDDIIFIQNPNPKTKPTVIVLCDSDDDDDNDDDDERKSKNVISLDDSVVGPVVVDVLSETDDEPRTLCSNNDTSSSSSQRVSSHINPLPDYIPLEVPRSSANSASSTILTTNELDKDKKLIKDWYDKFKTKDSDFSSSKSSYVCPECRAELSNVKMLDRHVQSRHPRSIHRYQHNNSKDELGNDSDTRETASKQRLRLNPLRSPNCISSASYVSTNDTNTLNKQNTCNFVGLPPLVNRKTAIQDKVTTTMKTTTGISITPERKKNNCEPLTVIIYSPNSNTCDHDRFVHISPLSNDKQNMKNVKIRIDNADDQNKKKDVIELFDSPCRDSSADVERTLRRDEVKKCHRAPRKRKRQDPLLLVTNDDDQDLMSRPAKNNKKSSRADEKAMTTKKTYSCDMHHKTFATSAALLQHQQAKHTNNCKKGNIKYSLRPGKDLNIVLSPSSSCPPSMDKLKTMKHIIMIDLDNWQKIFDSDLTFSPATFVWGFHGGKTIWKPPASSSLLNNLQKMNCFYLHPKCGNSKDAADFALCVQAGKLDALLPKDIIFTVLSGDRGFNELRNQLSLSKREVHLVNPHHKTIDTVLTILNSISEK